MLHATLDMVPVEDVDVAFFSFRIHFSSDIEYPVTFIRNSTSVRDRRKVGMDLKENIILN